MEDFSYVDFCDVHNATFNKEIPELDIDLGVKGWEVSGGKSFNVWGRVPISDELIEIVNSFNKKNKPTIVGLLRSKYENIRKVKSTHATDIMEALKKNKKRHF